MINYSVFLIPLSPCNHNLYQSLIKLPYCYSFSPRHSVDLHSDHFNWRSYPADSFLRPLLQSGAERYQVKKVQVKKDLFIHTRFK